MDGLCGFEAGRPALDPVGRRSCSRSQAMRQVLPREPAGVEAASEGISGTDQRDDAAGRRGRDLDRADAGERGSAVDAFGSHHERNDLEEVRHASQPEQEQHPLDLVTVPEQYLGPAQQAT